MAQTVFKVVLVGQSGVGKTSLLYRYLHQEFNPSISPTLGVDLSGVPIDFEGTKMTSHIWDTSGVSRFAKLSDAHLTNASAAIMVYDITNRASFLCLELWLEKIREKCKRNAQIWVLGNKCDCSSRQVSEDEGFKFCEDNGLSGFAETSALEGSYVKELFDDLLHDVAAHIMARIRKKNEGSRSWSPKEPSTHEETAVMFCCSGFSFFSNPDDASSLKSNQAESADI